MGELTGSVYPEQVVVLGGKNKKIIKIIIILIWTGHIDSWDVGQGASDDGGGVMMALEAVKAMIDLGFKPKRTIR